MSLILITGGAGFIGVNSASYFASQGWDVAILDNLSRKGSDINLQWLQTKNDLVRFFHVDVRDFDGLKAVIKDLKPDMLLHLAAQVAVTTSYLNPREDFEINALGTFNVLESVRLFSPDTFILYASTNKVYGGLHDVPVLKSEDGYVFETLTKGVSEIQPLDFHSPYGCSKGVADQYTLDYARIYDLRTCSFRQSCIYGIRQFGIEDQGWVAWFTIAAMQRRQITIYGDGWQTRDLLNVKDLAQAYEAAWHHQDRVSGEAFNIGGGYSNTLSLNKLIAYLEREFGEEICPKYGNSRPGDQPVFICDINKAREKMEWKPAINIREGVGELIDWVNNNKSLFT